MSPAGINLFKGNNGNTRTICETCLKLTRTDVNFLLLLKKDFDLHAKLMKIIGCMKGEFLLSATWLFSCQLSTIIKGQTYPM